MKRFLYIFLGMTVLVCGPACAEYVYGASNWNEHIMVPVGRFKESDSINISSSLSLENYGAIYGDISVDNGKVLGFKNSGVFYDTVRIATGGELVQIINSAADMNYINVQKDFGAKFSVVADGATGVNFTDLAALARDADKLVLKDSSINFVPGAAANIPIELDGNVIFNIHDVSGLQDYVLLSNVSGEGSLYVLADIPKLFHAETSRRDDKVILSVARETDYEKVVGGAEGKFINNLRASGMDRRLTSRLDGAMTESELNAIMADSVAFHPAKLMGPVSLLARFGSAGAFADDSGGGFGACGATAIFGEDVALYSGSIGAGFGVGGLTLGLSAHAGGFTGPDFAGKFYGLETTAAFDKKWLHAGLWAGFSVANFDAGPIFNGTDDAVYNPGGAAYYGAAEIGIRAFDNGGSAAGGFYVMPIIRARTFVARVLDENESEFAVGAGARVGYREEMLGLATEYSAYGLLESENSGQLGVRIGVSSPMDGAAVSLDAAVMKFNDNYFYKFGAGVRFLF
ncbi:MAG: hypothetical protein FWC61_04610 [Proteobacteria bacterium]|nr:hypothetical protein [Pseudomonadota bacterium]